MVFSEINNNPNILSSAEIESRATEIRTAAETRKVELKNIMQFAEEYKAQQNVEQDS